MTTCPPWANTKDALNGPKSIFDRTVAVHRLKTVAGSSDTIGLTGYSGAEQSLTSAEGETVLFTDLPASIQLGAAGRTTRNAGLPGDATTKPIWIIQIPATAISLYDIRDRDIILDDEKYRYEVAANYWTDLGYQLSTVRLEA